MSARKTNSFPNTADILLSAIAWEGNKSNRDMENILEVDNLSIMATWASRKITKDTSPTLYLSSCTEVENQDDIWPATSVSSGRHSQAPRVSCKHTALSTYKMYIMYIG